ncbi:hypothetical protein UZ36_01490 [Candidatus Nitromaritima sp. SCGC AAA799-C22]|nr:hypothetical protein UZ36_01490 [Candidatus Nitromaritima sp. SCGC AAA799-C22]
MQKMVGLKISKIIRGILFLFVVMTVMASPAAAQFGAETAYEVIAEAPAKKGNFVKARKKAVRLALRTALEQNLRELLGDDEYERNRREMNRMLRKSKKFVKSYRFLEAYDDSAQSVSQVKMEVVLFQDAVNKALSRSGVTSGMEGGKQVVILINESSLSSDNTLRFWETIPISETSLTRNFIEAGIPVVGRASIRHMISEDTVMNAVKGNVSAAVNIGLKAGADIVIVGNATSTPVGDAKARRPQPVRVAISIKVVSAHHSKLVAAKSDFATASGNEILAGELEAFHRASDKLTKFLIPAIQRHWESGEETKDASAAPASKKKEPPPLPLGDL